MPTSPAERRAQRSQVLQALYEATDGVAKIQSAYPSELAESTGLPTETVTETLRFLEEEGYAEGISLAGDYGITHDGINEAERDALEVQFATAVQRRAVEVLLTQLDRHLDEFVKHLDREQRAAFEAEKETLQAQLRSPRPNRGVLTASLTPIVHGS